MSTIPTRPHSIAPADSVTCPLIFIFLDGIGLGEDQANNPLATTKLPFLETLLGTSLLKDVVVRQADVLCQGIDACLGVPGIPQSATGQTALLTGCNAASHLGHHLPAFHNAALIDLIHRDSLLKRAKSRGLRATFANAYTPQYFAEAAAGKKTHSVTTHCVLAADLPFRMSADLIQEQAVYWDMTREHWPDAPTFVDVDNIGGILERILPTWGCRPSTEWVGTPNSLGQTLNDGPLTLNNGPRHRTGEYFSWLC